MHTTPAISGNLLAAGYARRHDNYVPLLAMACVAVYVLRNSLVPYVLSSPYVDYLAPVTISLLMITAAYVATGGIGRLNRCGLLVVAATGISLIHCERLDFVLPRWIGWVMLLLALGPINSTVRGRYLRNQMLAAMNVAFIAISFLSSLWWAAGMPNLGRGDFTGVMGHSMVLGPIAGYVCVLSLVRLFSRGSLLWLVPYCNSWLVAMLASSRAALVAAAVATLVLLALNTKRNLVMTFAALSIAALIVIMPTTSLGFVVGSLPTALTEGLANKSWNNSREQHWNARWDEFLSSPATGIGFVSAWEDTVGVDDETGSVETGSSYIAILSMTGYIGAAAWLTLIASIIYQVFKRWRRLSDRVRLGICGFASFWLVHLGAEGYIYAVGSLVGVTFWLWLGCLNDQLCEPARRPAKFRWARSSAPFIAKKRTALANVPVRPTVRGLKR